MSGPGSPATTQAPAPGPASSRTVAPPVLQQRAPSIRYIDVRQSDAIMESGTKSATVSHQPALDNRAGHCILLHPGSCHYALWQQACCIGMPSSFAPLKSASLTWLSLLQEFPKALYGCPYPAQPNGQLGACIPPPQCNCASGVCYGSC